MGRSIDNWNNEEIGITENDSFLNTADYNMTADILNGVKIKRRFVAQEMTGCMYPHDRYNVSAK